MQINKYVYIDISIIIILSFLQLCWQNEQLDLITLVVQDTKLDRQLYL